MSTENQTQIEQPGATGQEQIQGQQGEKQEKQGEQQEKLISTTITDDGEETKGNDETKGNNETKDGEDNNNNTKEVKLTVIPTSEFDRLCYQEQYKKFLFMSTVKAPYFRSDKRAPLDLICVIDESGSMSGERIKLVKETLEFIVKNLESNDRFGCVGYANAARCILDMTTMDDNGKKQALKAVAGATARGGTALCDGLLMGINLVRNRDVKNKAGSVASIMLFTDGQANMGPTSAPAIIQAVTNAEGGKISYNANSNVQAKPARSSMLNRRIKEEKKEKQVAQSPIKTKPTEGEVTTDQVEGEVSTSFTINTFGFGEGHNADLLQAISEHGRGMYAFIKDTSMISSTFAECLGGLVSVVAQNITLRVETLNEVKINKCLSAGITVKYITPNQSCEVALADIQSEESRNIIFELSVPNVNEPKADWPFARIACSYDNCVLDGTKEQINATASIERCESKETGERNDELDLQNNRLVAAEAMAEADELANNGRLQEARARLNRAQEHIQKSKTNKDMYSTGLIGDIQRCVDGLRDERSYEASGGKELKMNSKAHARERAVQSSAWASQEKYTNSSKKKMMSKFKG